MSRKSEMPMIVRKSGEQHTLTVLTKGGKEVWDFSILTGHQLERAHEMIVNFWCKERGLPLEYNP